MGIIRSVFSNFEISVTKPANPNRAVITKEVEVEVKFNFEFIQLHTEHA